MKRIRREADRVDRDLRRALIEAQCQVATREMATQMSQVPLPLLDMDTEAILNDAQQILDDLADVLSNDAFDKVRKQWYRTSAKDPIGTMCWLVNYAQQEGFSLEWWSLSMLSSDNPFPSYVLMIWPPPRQPEDYSDDNRDGMIDDPCECDADLLTPSLEAPYEIDDGDPADVEGLN
ncbi:hypothetical protein KKD80_00195 [Patescibacteria group bacterium]|nr:hypothetical protein [Patescibacteria group bacterium]